MKKKRKPLKYMEPYTPQWERLANIEARTFAPTAEPCEKCGRPVLRRWACNFCRKHDGDSQ